MILKTFCFLYHTDCHSLFFVTILNDSEHLIFFPISFAIVVKDTCYMIYIIHICNDTYTIYNHIK